MRDESEINIIYKWQEKTWRRDEGFLSISYFKNILLKSDILLEECFQ